MAWDADRWAAIYHRKSHPLCPHCGEELDMNDTEYASRHITYWAEDGPKEDECPSCYKLIFIQERIDREWTVGKTSDEAEE